MSSKSKETEAAGACTSSSGSGRKPRFPELPPKYSSSRELRNKAEKLRRDRLNKLIEEMRTLVPMISNRTKKSDTTRSSILRLTANFLRVSRLFPQDAGSEESGASGQSLVSEGLPHLESMDGFFFILSEDGRILFVSENIDKFIGYSQIEMMGFPIFNFTHPADQSKIRGSLLKKESLPSIATTSSDPTLHSPSVPASNSSSTQHERGPRQSFYIRLREKPLAKQDRAQYEHMHVVGHTRRQAESEEDKTRGVVGQYTFIGVMRPVRDRPITELSLVESVQDQYLTRHLPDGRIIYTDHRISTIAGYLPSEVKGKSAFNFFFAEDLPWTTMAMRHMFASSNGEGSTVYRLFTQTGELICLQTKGFLEFNKSTNKIESFLCINTVIRPEDSERYLNEQKERFTPFISELQRNTLAGSSQSLETTHSSSILSLLPSPSTVSVIAKPATNGSYSTSSSSVKSPGARNSLKRSYTELVNNQPEEYTSYERADFVDPYEMTGKRKLEDCGNEQQAKKKNWQYTARREPVHRTEDGIRVVDIEEQFSRTDNAQQEFCQKQDGRMEFQYLMNQMNKSLQESSNYGSVNPSQNFSSNEGLNQPGSEVTSNATSVPPPRRVGSVIRMLPHKQALMQKTSVETKTFGDPSDSSSIQPTPHPHQNTTNPLDNDRSLADYLSQTTFNYPLNNSIPRESDIIKQELISSHCSEAERIAEKLKVMLAPLSSQQDRNNSQIPDQLLADTPTMPPLIHNNQYNQDQTHSDSNNSDLLEILTQDLVFSLDGAHREEKLVSALKDEVPSTSS